MFAFKWHVCPHLFLEIYFIPEAIFLYLVNKIYLISLQVIWYSYGNFSPKKIISSIIVNARLTHDAFPLTQAAGANVGKSYLVEIMNISLVHQGKRLFSIIYDFCLLHHLNTDLSSDLWFKIIYFSGSTC